MLSLQTLRSDFLWVLGTQTQVVMVEWQAPYKLSHLLSPQYTSFIYLYLYLYFLFLVPLPALRQGFSV